MTADRTMLPNLFGLNIAVKDGRVFVYVAEELLWSGTVSEWSFALANPVK